MGADETFLDQLTEGIIFSGGTARFDRPKARALAERVLAKLYEIGPFAYPSLLDEEGLRFVYQWDESPPLMTLMLWDGQMWQDMARVPVPEEINNDVNR
ncbi:MAG TPA: hypothetical protein VD969_05445 [Symbiobacteriaceae bacterium]|nr:hypothetical protein [Symbiobacteriaceae bacterium]